MISQLRIQNFKSILDQTIDLGRVNVFIGANGSGKSNILEALGVLGAAAFGVVDDESLQRRGVRPAESRQIITRLHEEYNLMCEVSAQIGKNNLKTLCLKDSGNIPQVFISLLNDVDISHLINNTSIDNYSDIGKTSIVDTIKMIFGGSDYLKSRIEAMKIDINNMKIDINNLRNAKSSIQNIYHTVRPATQYAIYTPWTHFLRGIYPDFQTREPVGLLGGRLPEAWRETRRQAETDEFIQDAVDDAIGLIDWCDDADVASAGDVPMSPSAQRSPWVVRFKDRFMKEGDNYLSGFDASEGALYVLFYTVLALHEKAPSLLAVDNFDQALNPRLARALMNALCRWLTESPKEKQWLITTHNPAVLDGLPLQNDQVRLFAVDRTSKGDTNVTRIDLQAAMAKRPNDSWTLSRMWVSGYLGGVPNV